MDFICTDCGSKNYIKDYYADTPLHWDEAGNLIDMDYELDQAKRKLDQFLGYCSLYDIKSEDCVIVGDSDNDIALFKASGQGIAIGAEIPESLEQ